MADIVGRRRVWPGLSLVLGRGGCGRCQPRTAGAPRATCSSPRRFWSGYGCGASHGTPLARPCWFTKGPGRRSPADATRERAFAPLRPGSVNAAWCDNRTGGIIRSCPGDQHSGPSPACHRDTVLPPGTNLDASYPVLRFDGSAARQRHLNSGPSGRGVKGGSWRWLNVMACTGGPFAPALGPASAAAIVAMRAP